MLPEDWGRLQNPFLLPQCLGVGVVDSWSEVSEEVSGPGRGDPLRGLQRRGQSDRVPGESQLGPREGGVVGVPEVDPCKDRPTHLRVQFPS